MRLVDADAYAAEMRKKQDNCRAWKESLDERTELYARAEQSFITFVEAALTLKNQPTIDAIPVKWLFDWRDRALKEGMNPELVEWIEYILQIWSREKEDV